jgi:hypothetical protein
LTPVDIGVGSEVLIVDYKSIIAAQNLLNILNGLVLYKKKPGENPGLSEYFKVQKLKRYRIVVHCGDKGKTLSGKSKLFLKFVVGYFSNNCTQRLIIQKLFEKIFDFLIQFSLSVF